jgi:hypothetical protein
MSQSHWSTPHSSQQDDQSREPGLKVTGPHHTHHNKMTSPENHVLQTRVLTTLITARPAKQHDQSRKPCRTVTGPHHTHQRKTISQTTWPWLENLVSHTLVLTTLITTSPVKNMTNVVDLDPPHYIHQSSILKTLILTTLITLITASPVQKHDWSRELCFRFWFSQQDQSHNMTSTELKSCYQKPRPCNSCLRQEQLDIPPDHHSRTWETTRMTFAIRI